METLVERRAQDVLDAPIVHHAIHHVPMGVKAVEISVIQLVLVDVWIHA